MPNRNGVYIMIRPRKRKFYSYLEEKYPNIFNYEHCDDHVERKKEAKNESYLCLLDIIQSANNDDDKLSQLLETTLKNKTDRLILRNTMACKGKELTPIQLDQYISIIEYAIEYIYS
jgi:hypothetical protein